MAAKNYNIEEVKELWRQEPDDNIVFRAATEDIEGYASEVQAVIKAEAERRRSVQANAKPVSKQTVAQKAMSSVGLDYDPEETKDLQGAERLISLSLGATLLSASIVLVLSVVACFGYSILGITTLSFVDVVILLTLAYGLYRKSRICAVIIFIYWVVGKIGQSIAIGDVKPLVAGIFFGFFFFQGIRGTFAYHRLNKSIDTPQDEKVKVYRVLGGILSILGMFGSLSYALQCVLEEGIIVLSYAAVVDALFGFVINIFLWAGLILLWRADKNEKPDKKSKWLKTIKVYVILSLTIIIAMLVLPIIVRMVR